LLDALILTRRPRRSKSCWSTVVGRRSCSANNTNQVEPKRRRGPFPFFFERTRPISCVRVVGQPNRPNSIDEAHESFACGKRPGPLNIFLAVQGTILGPQSPARATHLPRTHFSLSSLYKKATGCKKGNTRTLAATSDLT